MHHVLSLLPLNGVKLSASLFRIWPHQQRFRGNEEDLSHDFLVVKTLVEFGHVVLGGHLSLHVFQVKLDLLWLQVIFPHITEDTNTQTK